MGEFISVAKKGEIAPGQVRVVEARGTRIVLCNVAGEFFGVEDRCTHDNNPLGEGSLEGAEIECPRHGARFDVRTGAVTCLPAVIPIKTYAVRVQDDDVQVEV